MKFIVTQVRTVEIEAEAPGFAADIARYLFAKQDVPSTIAMHATQTGRVKIESLDVTEKEN